MVSTPIETAEGWDEFVEENYKDGAGCLITKGTNRKNFNEATMDLWDIIDEGLD